MDVLAFLGSPRKKGNSEVLTQELLEGVRQAGGSPEIIRLCDLKISPCISCGGCDKILQKKGEWVDNPERKGFFISVAATRGARIFEGAILTMKYGYDAMGMQYGGDFLVTGPDKRGDMAKYEKKLAEAREAGKNFILGLDAHVD